jgi:hypothetical protein
MPFGQYNTDAAMQLSLGLFPFKFVQLFVDTCFMTVCSITHTAPSTIFGMDSHLDAWRQPLLLQLPAMAAAAIGAATLCATSGAARRALLRPPVLLALLIGGGVIVAYTGAIPSGAPHLRHGFMRDYVVGMVLLEMVLFALVAAAWPDGGARRARPQGPVALALFGTLVLAGMLGRQVSSNFLPDQALARLAYTPICNDDECRFTLVASNRAGRPVPLPTTTVAFTDCGGMREVRIAPLEAITFDKARCSDINLVPAVIGYVDAPVGFDHIAEPFDRHGAGMS